MAKPCCVQYCKNIGTHHFPKDEVRKTQWIQAIKHVKPGPIIRKSSLICSAHFRPADFAVTPTCFTKLDRAPRTLKRNAVPSIFAWTQSQEPIFDPSKIQSTYSRTPPIQYVETLPFLDTQNKENMDPLQLSDQEIELQPSDTVTSDVLSNQTDYQDTEQHSSEESPHLFMFFDQDDDNVTEIHSEKSVQTQTDETNIYEKQGIPVGTQTLDTLILFSIKNMENDDKTLHFYTGLECFQKIMLVLFSLGRSAYDLNYMYGPPPEKLDTLEQFFITLMILRRHTTFQEITKLYKISLKHVYTIFITWIRFMSLQWKTLDLWVDREKVRAYMPFNFHEKYPATRVIIDATECPIKKPKLPLAQQVTFSSYKNRNTIKFLVGITPGGLISYVSGAYGGYATDRHIIERSSILQKFNYNDEIMVDKGLDVQDIFVPYGVKVNMPAFFKKGNQIESATLSSNRKVASKRVHIERVIGMMKTYKILTQPMNHTEILLSSDIVFIISQLVNFRSNVINKNA